MTHSSDDSVEWLKSISREYGWIFEKRFRRDLKNRVVREVGGHGYRHGESMSEVMRVTIITTTEKCAVDCLNYLLQVPWDRFVTIFIANRAMVVK